MRIGVAPPWFCRLAVGVDRWSWGLPSLLGTVLNLKVGCLSIPMNRTIGAHWAPDSLKVGLPEVRNRARRNFWVDALATTAAAVTGDVFLLRGVLEVHFPLPPTHSRVKNLVCSGLGQHHNLCGYLLAGVALRELRVSYGIAVCLLGVR